jgi:hypothetical protein
MGEGPRKSASLQPNARNGKQLADRLCRCGHDWMKLRSRSLGCVEKDAWAGTCRCKRSKTGGFVARTLKIDWETCSPSHHRLSRLREGRGEIGHPRHLQPSPLDCQNTPCLACPPKPGRYAVCSISPAIQWMCICASSSRGASFVAFDMAIDCFDLAAAPQHLVLYE